VGIFGASGYVGRELCSLINGHPGLSLEFATANEQRGSTVRIAGKDVTFVATEDAAMERAEVIFSALPHGKSKQWVNAARERGARVVDLSSDLRPGNGCDGIPYGLTEIARDEVRSADVVANPGCYPTSILLALQPLIAAGVVARGSAIQVSAGSGVSGAGNAPKRELMFAEVAQDYRAYGVGNTHRHLAEMRATLNGWAADVDLVFTPHLLPVARGILSTITVELSKPLDDPSKLWRTAYSGEPFLEFSAEPPSLRDVVHRNVVRVSVSPVNSMRRPTLLILSAIDNLMKGAAGQAVQNANVMLGLNETDGLPA
jgi:N-acetyl-gamma-glutamyl-phosphate reductase